MSSEEATLEERVKRLEDHQAIGRLFRDYRRYLDGKDFESYSHLFVDDGEFGSVAPSKGPAAIKARVEALVGNNLREHKGDDLHLVANEVVEIDGDHATADVTWVYLVRDEHDNPRVEKVGHYEDVLIRHEGQWKFQRRGGGADIPTPPA